MKIFADLHHGDLYWSLYRLFVERLGYDLYRPIGMDWFYEGYWKIAEPYGNALDTVGQYLDVGHTEWDQYKSLNGNNYKKDNVYYIYEPVHDYYQKAITLETFKNMEFDIVLSSIVAHDKPYWDLQKRFQPKGKIVAQMGNTDQKTILPNVIHSVPYIAKYNQNTVFCYQELDLKLYQYVLPNTDTKNIYSVVNCYPYPHVYQQAKSIMPEVNMKNYGGGCPDGSLFGAKGVSKKMQEANMGWHIKPVGGLGHSAMGWFASGRPTVTNMNHHRKWGGDATRLYEPGVTCIDIDANNINDVVKQIRLWLHPEEQIKRSELVYNRFKELFKYDEQEHNVRNFIERLV